MVGGTDHTHYREGHRLEMHLAGRTTDINGIDHKGWWEGHICHREDHTSMIYLAGKTTMVGGTDHTYYREDHRL
jgi:hypothetical protein